VNTGEDAVGRAEKAATNAADSAAAAKKSAETKIPTITTVLAILSVIAWVLAWVLLWISGAADQGSWADKRIYEPAIVGLSLGFVAIAWFAAIYFREEDTDQSANQRLRSAIAGSVVLVFVLLVIDLLTLANFRVALQDIKAVVASSSAAPTGPSGSASASGGDATAVAVAAQTSVSFVEGLLDSFKWVVITIVGFYFAAGTAEAVTKKVSESKEARADAEVRAAEAKRDAASATLDAARIHN
jgi:uncharacterized membrane protein